MTKVREMEFELRYFWQLMQKPADMTLAEYKDELEVLHEMTDWPALKAACERAMARFTPTGKAAVSLAQVRA